MSTSVRTYVYQEQVLLRNNIGGLACALGGRIVY